MGFQIKNKFGIILAFLLFFILFQSNSFPFLIHTILGRFVLVMMILGISSVSCVFGIIAVLIVIIYLNQDNYIYLEGFVDKSKKRLHEEDTMLSTSSAAASTETFVAREGYNQLERERVMQKGKRSSEIRVKKGNQSTEDVEPNESETFSNMSENV